MRASHVGLEHAPTPHGCPAIAAEVVDQPALPMSSDSSGLDVDDATAAKLECLPCIIRAMDALIETNRRLQLLLQHSVIDDVIRVPAAARSAASRGHPSPRTRLRRPMSRRS